MVSIFPTKIPTQFQDNSSALILASSKGHSAAVQTLLADKRVMVNLQDKVIYRTFSDEMPALKLLMCSMDGLLSFMRASMVTAQQCKLCWPQEEQTSMCETR